MSTSRALRQIRLQRTNSNVRNSVSLTTPSALNTSYKLTLPNTVPTSTQALLSDTNGILSWGSVSSAATQSTFTAANNVTSPTPVTGLSASTSPVTIPVYVSLIATANLVAIIHLQIYYNNALSSYVLDSTYVGDNTQVRFDITAAGQVVYYSGNYAGFSSLTFSWFAPFTPVASVTSSLSLSSSLNVGTSTILASSNISGTPSSTAGGLLSIQGATFNDTSTAASSTTSAFNATYLAAPTLTATNSAVTTSTASTLTIAGPPIAGTNETITNVYSIFSTGPTMFIGPMNVNGNLALTGRLTGGTKDFLEFSMSSATIASSVASNFSAPVTWNTTPTNQTGFPTYTTAFWTNGNNFTPGVVGLYLIVWSVNSNTSTGTTGNNEIVMFRNSSNAYGGPNQLGLINVPASPSAEVVMTALFNVSAVTDYVYFGWYNGNTGSVTFTSSGALPRNILRITRL